jgi:hypothetical protein
MDAPDEALRRTRILAGTVIGWVSSFCPQSSSPFRVAERYSAAIADRLSLTHLPCDWSEEIVLNCRYQILAGIFGAAVVLLMGACGSGDKAQDPAPATADTAVDEGPESLAPESAFPTEGPVTTADGRFIKYPDGFRIDFMSAQQFTSDQVEKALPGSYDVETDDPKDVAAGSVAIKVTLKYTNGTLENIPLENQTMMAGLYGENRLPAEAVNWAGDNIFAQDPMPTRITSGATATFWRTFEVPKSDVGTFVVEPTLLGEYTPWTFTDIGKVVKVAR